MVENVANIARLDVGRVIRRGIPEIVFAEGKSNEDLIQICRRMLQKNERVLVSRVDERQLQIMKEHFSSYEIEKPPHAALLLIHRKDSTNRSSGGRALES